MKRITESQLKDKVAHLRAIVKEATGPLRPSADEINLNPTASTTQGDMNPNNNLQFPSILRPGENPNPAVQSNKQGYVYKYPNVPTGQTSPRVPPKPSDKPIPGGVVDNAIKNPLPPAKPQTNAQPVQGADGHWYDPITKFASNVGDDLKYSWDHLGDLAQGTANKASQLKHDAYTAIAGDDSKPHGQTNAQAKVGAKQGGKTGGKTGGQGGQGGSYNPQVAELQQRLKASGYDIGTTGPNHDGIDGIMGPKTEAAYKQYFNNPATYGQQGAAQSGEALVDPQTQKAADDYVARMIQFGIPPDVITKSIHNGPFKGAKVNIPGVTTPAPAASSNVIPTTYAGLTQPSTTPAPQVQPSSASSNTTNANVGRAMGNFNLTPNLQNLPVQESVTLGQDPVLARIVELSRKK